jgi:hypothetical protein
MFQFQNEKNQGIIVNDASKENKVEIITVTQNCVMIFETNPVLIAIGKNTTTITKVIEVRFRLFQLFRHTLHEPYFSHFHVPVIL